MKETLWGESILVKFSRDISKSRACADMLKQQQQEREKYKFTKLFNIKNNQPTNTIKVFELSFNDHT